MNDMINPKWKRPDDWTYKEDWGSPAWEKRMVEVLAKARNKREQFGFIECPKCQVVHTAKTIMCRKCEYKAEISASPVV